MVKRVLMFVFLAFYPLNCIKVSGTPNYPDYNVFALLRLGVDTQEVFVDHVYDPGDTILMGVNSASVSIIAPDTQITYEPHVSDSLVLFIAPSGGWLQPEHEYTLRVEIPGSELIEAKTKVPGDFEIVYPQNHDTVDTNTALVWTSSRYAYYYIVSVYPVDSFLNKPPFYIPLLTRDTLLDRFVYPFFFQGTGDYLVRVEAIDSSYFRYISYEEGNIDNAMGVFGGTVVKELTVHYEGGMPYENKGKTSNKKY